MDDALYGIRNKRGDWKPAKLSEYPPVFVWPARPIAFLRWLFGYPGYLFPWNVGYAAISFLVWRYGLPSMEAMKSFSVGWIAGLFAENVLLTILFFGAFHLRLYVQRAQGTSFKYNGKWPATSNTAFLFKSQTIDNLIWTFLSGVPIWTAYEVVTLWLYAHHYIPSVSIEAHPIYCGIILLLIPVFRDFHFYLIHRLIHSHALYHTIHKLHHNNVNPGPWSGLSMHPVEHLLYFSVVAIHWIVPSNPLHAIFNLTHAGLAPAPGHAGFEKVVVGDNHAIDTHSYEHYLHHKFFECNYADGVIPLDKWFGTFHDGSADAEQRMNKRFMDRAAEQTRKRDGRKAATTT
jgi:sterol desaturase/sphingolipid hydroxylase (fatty acid hydroxylase superfamily)